MNKEFQIGYRIIRIHTTSYSVQDLPEAELNMILQNGNSSLNIGSNINFDQEKSTLTVDIKTTLRKKSGKKDLVSHTGRTVFFVQDLQALFNEDDNAYKLPDNFILQLLGISFSHSRALLATELQSTLYADRFILPVVNPKILLPKDLK